jgi:hypothetical protein
MSSAKRRINSTGRKRIGKDCVDIRLLPLKSGEPLAATAALKLDDFGFPASSPVILEAYGDSSSRRFECGTVGDLKIPPVLGLEDIDRSGSVLFRLKVVDSDGVSGKLIGSAESLRPGSRDEDTGRRSIFPIIEGDLGDEVWRVKIDDTTGPVLLLNFRIPGFKHKILENPLLQGILLPAAFRIVLEYLAKNPDFDEDADESWKVMWLKYIKEQFGIDDELSELEVDDLREWVDGTVASFCQWRGFINKISTEFAGNIE